MVPYRLYINDMDKTLFDCSKYNDLTPGDPVIYRDLSLSFANITRHKIYYILSIYSTEKIHFFQLIDDDNLISSHKADNFIGLDLNRNKIISQLI